ncbi:hypothetical protein HD806DRAFT_535223 [Xylariaceae sp. AK1471]|nr:hypothetical protein HD806DRAFT_535223 [Xylariaceae sp. AK1471]
MATMDHLAPQKEGNETTEQKYVRLLEQHNRLLMERREVSGPAGLRRLSTTVHPGQELQSPVDSGKEADLDSENIGKIHYRMNRFNKEGFQVEEKHDPDALQGTQTNATGRVATFVYHFDRANRHIETEIKIESDAVRCVLQENLKHYPGYHWKNPSLSLFAPFQPLIHNWDTLLQATTEKPEDEGCTGLKAILDAVKTAKEVKEYFVTRDSADDSVAFDFLWTIFPPGELILLQSSFMKEQHQVFIVREAFKRERENGDRPYIGIVCWTYDWDGARRKFHRVAVELKIDYYKGKRLITSLPCYPLDYHSSVETIKAELISRGKRFRELCMSPPGKQMYEYDALAYFRGTGVRHLQGSQSSSLSDESSFIYRLTGRRLGRSFRSESTNKKGRQQTLKGKVMIDFESYIRHGPAEPTPIGDLTLADGDEDDECRCDVCMEDGGPKENQKYLWDNNEGIKDKSFCSDQYLICPPRVLGYHLMEKKWVELQVTRVANIEKSQFADAFAKLQLSEKKKVLIRDLVKGHTNDKIPDNETPRNRMNDLTKGKGEGLVILLHESIAQATEKPLFPIGVGDVTTDPSLVEKRLEQLFELAEAWQAVMLFDEADVFLESRAATTDVTRVGLVSVLLRVLEYYQGILILTTNRIRSFDIAVQSRINLAVKFEDLTEKQKKNIFRNLVLQLDHNYVENRSTLLKWMDEDEDTSVSFSKLNGRQVRNIVFSAASLAGNRSPPDNILRKDDIQKMLSETVEFQKHLHELTKMARQNNEV